jgi:pyruvate dehydrogenase E1 component alpha subunit
MSQMAGRTELSWRFLEQMLLMRRFEEAVGKLGSEKAFPGHYHLYIGQEATGAGAMEALARKDVIATTHRNHGHVIARGSDPTAALAEILGREGGLNRGRGGTIHLSDPSLGFLQTSGVVGSVVGLAVGGGFACKQKGEGAVSVAFFGDGALEEGTPFEAMNLAALWKLPVLFVCENNSADAWGAAKGGYPTLVHATNDLRSIPGSMGIGAVRVEGADPFAVYDAVSNALDNCRSGKGPVFIEAMTRRWAGSNPLWPELSTGITDIGMALGDVVIDDSPHREWFAKDDPVLRLVREIIREDPEASDRIRETDTKIAQRIREATETALASPYPALETAEFYTFA